MLVRVDMGNIFRETIDTEDGLGIRWYGHGLLGERVALMQQDTIEEAYQLGLAEGREDGFDFGYGKGAVDAADAAFNRKARGH